VDTGTTETGHSTSQEEHDASGLLVLRMMAGRICMQTNGAVVEESEPLALRRNQRFPKTSFKSGVICAVGLVRIFFSS